MTLKANRLCDLLGIAVPILQAPTGSIAGPELAAAVSEAGGLGAMGLTWTPPEEAAALVRQTRASTQNPFQVNFALAFEPISLPSVLDAGAPVITFSWGDAARWIPEVYRAGAKAGVQVGNREGARRAVEAGADFLICQGIEAGGHVQSTTSRETVLEGVLAEVGASVPIVAAGGLATGTDIAGALHAGAQGVLLGTRFVATQESRAHSEYKRRLVEAIGEATALTICFEGGWPYAPHRVLRNTTLERWETEGCPPPEKRPGEGETIAHTASGAAVLRYEDTAPRAGMQGDLEAMALYAGTGVSRILDLPPAGELLLRLWLEATQALRGRD